MRAFIAGGLRNKQMKWYSKDDNIWNELELFAYVYIMIEKLLFGVVWLVRNEQIFYI